MAATILLVEDDHALREALGITLQLGATSTVPSIAPKRPCVPCRKRRSAWSSVT